MKIKDKLKEFNFTNLSIFEKIGCIICLVLSLIALFSVFDYTESRFRNTAFELENNEANNTYNDIANELSDIGYTVNMVDDKTYNIYGNYEVDDIISSVSFKMDKNGNILENNIEFKFILSEKILYNMKSIEVLNSYEILNSTLNILNISLSMEDFEMLIKDANNYNDVRHGIYKSNDYNYEIFNDGKYINIIIK